MSPTYKASTSMHVCRNTVTCNTVHIIFHIYLHTYRDKGLNNMLCNCNQAVKSAWFGRLKQSDTLCLSRHTSPTKLCSSDCQSSLTSACKYELIKRRVIFTVMALPSCLIAVCIWPDELANCLTHKQWLSVILPLCLTFCNAYTTFMIPLQRQLDFLQGIRTKYDPFSLASACKSFNIAAKFSCSEVKCLLQGSFIGSHMSNRER